MITGFCLSLYLRLKSAEPCPETGDYEKNNRKKSDIISSELNIT
jgi:hypothetical protein